MLTVACLVASGLLLFRGLPSLPERSEPPTPAAAASNTPSEPRYVTANIEDLRVGDTVLAEDPETGELVERRIVDAFSRTAYRLRVLTIRGPDGKELPPIRTTDEHPFWVVELEDFLPAGDLEVGDQFLAPDGQLTTLLATESEAHPEGVTVYNFEVEGAHTYFVLPESLSDNSPTLHAPPVLVHNATNRLCLGPHIKKPAIAKGKKYGSYTVNFKNGMKYHGKGPWSRGRKSARDILRNELKKDPSARVDSIDWTPARNDRQAFIDEALRIRGDGGIGQGTERNFNMINSPGAKHLPSL